MNELVTFNARPPLRCFHLEGERPVRICGELATHRRDADGTFPAGYFCPKHKRPSDQAIGDGALLRMVTISLEVRLAGVSWNPGIAQTEVVARLERAIERAGGLVNLLQAGSVLGLHAAPRPLRARSIPGDLRRS